MTFAIYDIFITYIPGEVQSPRASDGAVTLGEGAADGEDLGLHLSQGRGRGGGVRRNGSVAQGVRGGGVTVASKKGSRRSQKCPVMGLVYVKVSLVVVVVGKNG